MPQFDPTFFASQIFWLFISLGILFFVMKKLALPKIAGVYDLRSDKIQGRDQEADVLMADAEKINKRIDAEIDKARKEAQSLINVATHEMQNANSQRRNEFVDLLQKRVSAATKSIEIKKRKAQSEIQKISSEAAIDIFAKCLPQADVAAQIKSAEDKVAKIILAKSAANDSGEANLRKGVAE